MTPSESTRESIIRACSERMQPVVAERLIEAQRQTREKWRGIPIVYTEVMDEKREAYNAKRKRRKKCAKS